MNASSKAIRRRRRGGFTLIELVINMAAGLTLLLLGIQVIQQTLQFSDLNRDRGNQQHALARLMDHLRSDVHTATAAETQTSEASQAVSLILTMPDETRVTYEMSTGGVHRRGSLPGGEQNSTLETFKLSNAHRVEVVADQVSVDVRIYRQVANEKYLEGHVGAVLNRWQRFQR